MSFWSVDWVARCSQDSLKTLNLLYNKLKIIVHIEVWALRDLVCHFARVGFVGHEPNTGPKSFAKSHVLLFFFLFTTSRYFIYHMLSDTFTCFCISSTSDLLLHSLAVHPIFKWVHSVTLMYQHTILYIQVSSSTTNYLLTVPFNLVQIFINKQTHAMPCTLQMVVLFSAAAAVYTSRRVQHTLRGLQRLQ